LQNFPPQYLCWKRQQVNFWFHPLGNRIKTPPKVLGLVHVFKAAMMDWKGLIHEGNFTEIPGIQYCVVN
jgi:hypothetical protein